MSQQKNSPINDKKFWSWLFRGSDKVSPGYKNITDHKLSLFIYLIISIIIYTITDTEIQEAASSLMLPLCGAFFGLTFAWSSNINTILSSDEIQELSTFSKDNLEGYIYYTQTVILIVISTILCWGLTSLGIFNNNFFYIPFIFITALSIRESWAVILFSQNLILTQKQIRQIQKESSITTNRDNKK
ncbi:hypothetical protein LWC08_03750 [Desulfobaculum bizertense]|uniref:hypothetical protein n=1 Tax=Desulfobaculum bizertense TaxID=376490 RepID=UPI001F36887A|nr:hypothetical protein [Desulfobaculum bizertense]UIJ38693.1 hypothetical protein LWC08_03750 [Desulfobaculum bizertense]